MAAPPCPTCRAHPMRPLHAANIGSLVLYYRCDGCGHVLAVDKLDGAAPPHTVTQGTCLERVRHAGHHDSTV